MGKSLAIATVVAVSAAFAMPAAAPADGSHGLTASTSGWKKRCNAKLTKRKRRACRRRHRLSRLAGDFSGGLTTTINYFSFCVNQFVGSQAYQLQNVRVSVRRSAPPDSAQPRPAARGGQRGQPDQPRGRGDDHGR